MPNLGTPVLIFLCLHYWDLMTNSWRFINCRFMLLKLNILPVIPLRPKPTTVPLKTSQVSSSLEQKSWNFLKFFKQSHAGLGKTHFLRLCYWSLEEDSWWDVRKGQFWGWTKSIRVAKGKKGARMVKTKLLLVLKKGEKCTI